MMGRDQDEGYDIPFYLIGMIYFGKCIKEYIQSLVPELIPAAGCNQQCILANGLLGNQPGYFQQQISWPFAFSC